MPRVTPIHDLLAFLAVARERSFTRAADKLGVSQSALSHSLRGLESRLGLRLLHRTTRSVSPTEAGERLLQTIGPNFDEIEHELQTLSALRDKPAGTVRITSGDHAANTILWPAFAKLLPQYPDINVEININYGLVDIVAGRFDAGVRFGEQIEKDMVAVPIGPDMRMAVVGTPAYLKAHPAPVKPADLTAHNCINLRLPTRGGLYAWEFENRKRELKVHVSGQFTCNNVYQALEAALAGLGLAYVPEDLVQSHVEARRLQRVLADWCPPFPGYHLYYPSRRNPSPAFALAVAALRHSAPRLRVPTDAQKNAATKKLRRSG